MKIIVTGVNGQLGYDVVLELSKRGHEIIATEGIYRNFGRKGSVCHNQDILGNNRR